jgi:hypothetical protein
VTNLDTSSARWPGSVTDLGLALLVVSLVLVAIMVVFAIVNPVPPPVRPNKATRESAVSGEIMDTTEKAKAANKSITNALATNFKIDCFFIMVLSLV